jgi:hypothetical protein
MHRERNDPTEHKANAEADHSLDEHRNSKKQN